jgi:hypothetical protein
LLSGGKAFGLEIGGKVPEIGGTLDRGGKDVTTDLESGGSEEGGGRRGEGAVIAIEGKAPPEIGGKGVSGTSLTFSIPFDSGEVRGILILEISGRGDIGISGAEFIDF